MLGLLRRYFISGLLVWVPIWITIIVLRFFIKLLNASQGYIPAAWHPESWLGFAIPGFGVIITVSVIMLTGAVVANYIGRRLVGLWDRLVNRIPLIRTVYSSVKQVLTTIFSSQGQAFRKVLLVEWPRKGLWSIAFQTGSGSSELKSEVDADDLISIFIPTTPNPTSGFLMMVPRKEIKVLSMSVEEGLRYVISLGVVQPGLKSESVPRKHPKTDCQ